MAGRRAHKAWSMQRGPEGNWLDVKVLSPAGLWTKNYVNKDKIPKQQRTEQFTKKLFKVVVAQMAADESHKDFQDLQAGVISVGLSKIAKVELVARDLTPTLLFQDETCRRLGINKSDVRRLFEQFSQR